MVRVRAVVRARALERAREADAEPATGQVMDRVAAADWVAEMEVEPGQVTVASEPLRQDLWA